MKNTNTLQRLLILGQYAGLSVCGAIIVDAIVTGFWKYVIHDVFGWGMVSYAGGFFTTALVFLVLGVLFTLRETGK